MKERYRLPAVERFIEYMKQQARQTVCRRNGETDSKNVLKIYLKDIVNFKQNGYDKSVTNTGMPHAMEKENFIMKSKYPENF